MERREQVPSVGTGMVPSDPLRPLEQISAEINLYKAQTAQNILEIGRRLKEAKAQVPHGEWADWLREKVDFSERSARDFMRVAEEYGNRQALADLGYTKLLTLLQVPAEERETFLAEAHPVDGQEKTVAEMSTRELERVIRERDAAQRERDAAAKEAELALARVRSLEELNETRVSANHKLTQRIKELENRPVEVAVQEPPPEVLDQLRKEARDQAAKEAERLQEQVLSQARTINDLQVRLNHATPAETLPLAVIQGARTAFQSSVRAAVGTFTSIALCMTVDQAAEECDDCVETLQWAVGELRSLQARAEELRVQDEGLELEDFEF